VTRAILDRAASEEEVLLAVTDALSLRGWRWHHVRRSDRALQQGHGGFPDVIAVKGQRLIVAELKGWKGRVTSDQGEWLEAFRRAGAEWWVVRPSILDAFLRSLEEWE
jgi:hypothetical protein